MSVIAVRKYADKIVIAGDSQTSWGHHKLQSKDRSDAQITASGKIATVNGMILGFAGSTAHISLLLMYAKTHSPKEMTKDSVLDWFIEFRDWAVAKAKLSFNEINVHAILIKDGKIFTFYDFIDASEITTFDAVGSGMWLAIGAMEVGCDPETAVQIACKYDLYCGGETTVLTINL